MGRGLTGRGTPSGHNVRANERAVLDSGASSRTRQRMQEDRPVPTIEDIPMGIVYEAKEDGNGV